MKKFIQYGCLVFVASGVQAGGWEGPANVQAININANGLNYMAIQMEGVVHSEPNCSGNQKVAMLHYDHPAYDSVLSLVLAAKMGGYPISMVVEGCNAHGYPQIEELVIR